jgi:hypothetical protein
MTDAFELADSVLHQGVTGISDLITKPGLINVDFADVCTIMRDQGLAHFGIGESTSVEEAAQKAINSPLLETSIQGARNILLNISSGTNLSILEVNSACDKISEVVDEDAEIIFGTSINEELGDRVIVTVVATSLIDENEPAVAPEPVQAQPAVNANTVPQQAAAPQQLNAPQYNVPRYSAPQTNVPQYNAPQQQRSYTNTASNSARSFINSIRNIGNEEQPVISTPHFSDKLNNTSDPIDNTVTETERVDLSKKGVQIPDFLKNRKK